MGQVVMETAPEPERESEGPLRERAGEPELALEERFPDELEGGLRPKWVPEAGVFT